MSASTQRLLARARHTFDMLNVLAVSDLRVRYGRSAMRSVKWFLDPFAALSIYLILIVFVLDRSTRAPGLMLTCAIVPFQLVMTSTLNSFRSIQSRASIIANMAFPRWLIPLSAVATETIAFSAALSLIPLMLVAYGVAPTPAILWLPVAVAATLALAAGMAYPGALFGIWYPELQPFAISIIRAMFFLAPGLVALDQITGTTRELMPFNPLTGLFESYRAALLYGHAPAAWQLLVPVGVAAVLLAISVPAYLRDESRLAKLVGA